MVMNGVGARPEPQDVAVDTKPETNLLTTESPSHPPLTPKLEEPASDCAPKQSSEDQIMAEAAAVSVDSNDNGETSAAVDVEGDSEAETLIQSPEKQRTNADAMSVSGSAHTGPAKEDDSPSRATATDSENRPRKRKRSVDDQKDESLSPTSSRRSSPLSSPRAPTHSADSDSGLSSRIELHRSKQSPPKRENNPTADSDDAEEKPVKIQTRRRRPSDILPPISKHRTKTHNSGADPGSSERRETRSATYPRHSSNERSPSPRPPARREHRRGVSTQLTLGDVERKKRGRPPAINTKRSGSADHRAPSASESDSDSPQTSRPTLNKLSSADHDAMSPAKATGPRKIRDKNGRTALSRACNANDLVSAQARLIERPQDLNLADNAGNTPLQIASLMGFEDIVKFLLENNADVDTRNIDKETPLIDAVENGHVEVVRLLLENGANPRLGNAKGDEPYELVPLDDPNHAELRKLLADARENNVSRRKSSDQMEVAQDRNSSRAASAASPRDSPPVTGPRSPPNLTQRRRTGRSESTRNDLLWQANTQDNLTRLAAKGDVQGVANILNILQKAETESLIAAAKAGHEEVLQYLLGMGDPESDPEPLRHLKTGYNTPVLAAIGRGHPEVVKLLVEQSGFNPTRRILKGKAYHEIAFERKGEQWQKEVDILKTAYDKHAAGRSRKGASPRMTRDSDKQKNRPVRRSQSPISSKLRNSNPSSPTLTQKSLPNKSPQSSQKFRDRDSGSTDGGDRRKNLPARRDIGDASVAVSSDQDQTVNMPRKSHVKRRSQSDLPPAPQLDLDSAHRRRRLVSGKEHRRRKSIVEEEVSDENESTATVKTETKPSTVLKRQRESVSPHMDAAEEGEAGRGTAKKRRTVVESSPEESRPGPKRRGNQTLMPVIEHKTEQVLSEDERPKRRKLSKTEYNLASSENHVDESGMGKPDESSHTGNSDDADTNSAEEKTQQNIEEVEIPVKTEPIETGPSEAELELQKREEERKAEEAKRAEEERLAAEKAAEEAAEKAAEEIRLAEEKERIRKAEEEAERRRKDEEERQERIKRELEERQRRQEEQLRLQRLEIERRRREALPALLCQTALVIDNDTSAAKSVPWLSKFLPLFTVKSSQLGDQISDAEHDGLWVPNFQVAGLLATKDLNLRNYTSLEKRLVSPAQRQSLWKVSRNMLSYEYEANALNTTIKQANQREEDERPKFFAMEELFWVKLSDFEDQVFRHPHLISLLLKKQAISLRTIGLHTPTEQSPQTNGICLPSTPKLTNGVNPVLSPALYSNGYTRL